jgi:hypothetical protein
VAGRGCLSPGECQDNYDSDADPEAVTHRRILIRYRRDPGRRCPRRPLTWIGRRSDRQREIIREEFAARGYPLPA